MKSQQTIPCPNCGTIVSVHRNPLLTVDIIIRMAGAAVVLIERKNPPYGWALPGGFVDYGESLEAAAWREAREETGLEVECLEQFRAYSDPNRDPRHHTVTIVFSALAKGIPEAADDALRAKVFRLEELPDNLVFDHARILADYFNL
ncbi:MAG TPA: NUDIX hydrolase [Syntrophobacteraceae bacterium]|nr:NUDIX hydrolase [Syntrophobacteraceae bacterium]